MDIHRILQSKAKRKIKKKRKYKFWLNPNLSWSSSHSSFLLHSSYHLHTKENTKRNATKVLQVSVKFKWSTVDNHQEDDLINMTHTKISVLNQSGQPSHQAGKQLVTRCMPGGVKTPAHREKYIRKHCVWNWSTKNPSRLAHSISKPQHTAPALAHSTSTSTQHHSSTSSLCSWVEHQEGIHLTKSNQ
jgi:hypothetical protein